MKPVVILSSIDWDTAWQRHQIFAAQFAAQGRQVFFVENTGFRAPRLGDAGRVAGKLKRLLKPQGKSHVNNIPKNVTVISPAALPPTNPVSKALNSSVFAPKILAKLPKGAIVIVYMPTPTTVELGRRLDASVLVFDCASNFLGHPDAPKDVAKTMAELHKLAKLVVTDSTFLYEQQKALHPNVVQIHQGVPEDFFGAVPQSGHKKFCAYGTWTKDSDAVFLNELAKAGFEVAVSGFMKAPATFDPRIELLGPVAREQLVKRLERFDALLMPYKINDFMLGVVPAKLYECLAMGRPVIATPLPSLVPLKGLLYIGETPQDWYRIARDLPRTETPELIRRRVELARQHTHAAEFARLAAEIEKAAAS